MKRSWIVAAGWVAWLSFLWPAGAMGQEGEGPGEPSPPPQEGGREGRRDRRERGEDRLLEEALKQLGLEGEKAEAFRAAFEEGQKAAREAAKARDEKLKEILGEEKFREFQEMARRAGRRGQGQGADRPGGRSGEGPRGARGGEGSPLDRSPRDLVQVLKRELDLDEEQVKKVAEIVAELQGEIQALAEKAREEGGDREAAREKARGMVREVTERLQPVLRPEQMEKLQELRRRLGRRLFPGDRPGPEAEGDGGGDPAETRRRTLEAIREDLGVVPEVWAVLGEKIEGILDAEQAHRKASKERAETMAGVVNSGATAEAILAEMKAFREFKAAHEAALAALRKELRELLDLKEEAKLILHGILD